MSLHDRVSHRLKLRDLRLLMAVAEWGSMAKAAAHLNLTQSGVSKAIAELEHTLGVRLFDRTPQGAEPTLYGRALLKGGVGVFDELRQSVNAIEHLADPTTGELRLGCTEPMAWGIVPTIIERLIERSPRLVFHVTQADPATLRYRELRERKIELAIGRIAGPIQDDDIEAEILYDEELHVVAGMENRWVRRRKIKLADLVDEPWSVPPPDSFAGSLIADVFRESGLPPPRINVVAFSTQLHNALLASGRFLCLLPGTMLRFSAKRMSLKILPIDLPIRPGPVGIVTLKNRMLSPVAELFVDCAREIAKSLAKKN
jgi:DNA-binding transcriptional LysR family regulator